MGGGGFGSAIGQGMMGGLTSGVDQVLPGVGSMGGALIGQGAGGGGKSGGGKSGPASPDFAGLAQQQSTQNHNNVSTPGGSFNWTQDPTTGQWSGSESLNPNVQSALTGQQQMQAQRTQGAQGMLPGAMDKLSHGVDYAGLGQLDNGSAARDQAISGAYGQATSRLDPRFAQDQTSLRNQLYGQGLREGDQAYDNAMKNFELTKNDAYTSAMNSAIGQGTSAQQATFGENMAARQQNIGEQQANQYQGLNAMNSLLGGQQVQQPEFPGMGQQGANLLGAGMDQYQAGLNSYNARNGMLNGALPGLGPFLFS